MYTDLFQPSRKHSEQAGNDRLAGHILWRPDPGIHGAGLSGIRVLKTRIICSCGQVLDWDSEFCLNCGKDIKKTIMRKNSINNTIKSIKKVFR